LIPAQDALALFRALMESTGEVVMDRIEDHSLPDADT
jgi:hypothetical protein